MVSCRSEFLDHAPREETVQPLGRQPLTSAEVAESYRRFGALVLRRCRANLRGHADAQDVQQEVFLRLWRYASGYREAASQVAFLYRIADRCCFDVLARHGVRREAPLEEAAADLSWEGPSPLASAEHRELAQQFLSRFDDRVKQVAMLHYLDGATQEEMSAATGWSRPTIFSKLSLLRRRAAALREKLWGGGKP